MEPQRVDPAEPLWEDYYTAAARRRRARRRHAPRMSAREEIRRKNRVETLLMFASIALLGALMLIFHQVLSP